MVLLNELDIVRNDGKIELVSKENQVYGLIEYAPTSDDKVIDAPHTYVSSKLRGQGAAGRLLDELVAYAREEGLKINPICSYVVRKFDEEPDKFSDVDARQ